MFHPVFWSLQNGKNNFNYGWTLNTCIRVLCHFVMHNKGNGGAQKGKCFSCLWCVHYEKNDCEKVFKDFVSETLNY